MRPILVKLPFFGKNHRLVMDSTLSKLYVCFILFLASYHGYCFCILISPNGITYCIFFFFFYISFTLCCSLGRIFHFSHYIRSFRPQSDKWGVIISFKKKYGQWPNKVKSYAYNMINSVKF